MKKLLVLLIAISTCLSMMVSPALAEETYNIGICQLIQHAALDDATLGFCTALTDLLGDNVTFDLHNASGDPSICTTIINTLVSKKVDLILANSTAALQAAWSGTEDIPILGTSITDYITVLGIDDWTGVSGYNVSGTCDLAPLDGQAAMVKELFPDAKEIGILYCSAETNSLYQVKIMTEYLTELGYNCTNYPFTDSNDINSVTASACAKSDVIYIPTDNTAASCALTIRNVVESAGVPVIAGEEGLCAGCGVASLSISYYDLGYVTGQMAYEILVNGADISTMPVAFATEVTKCYNAEICDILDITVPEDYVALVVE